MIERKRVVAKVVELMDQIGDLQEELYQCANSKTFDQATQSILIKSLVVDYLMWVLDLGDPKQPGASLVREEHARNIGESK